MEETNPELDSFRQQWRAEVSGRTKGRGNERAPGSAGPSKAIRRPPAAPRIAADPASRFAEEEDHVEPQTFSGLDTPTGGVEGQEWSTAPNTEPRSALEHYEKAVERESQGNLGDSLDLYRKAFKLDHRVDLIYKNKHFPPSSFVSKSTNPNPTIAQPTATSTARHSPDGPPPTIKQLIAGFQGVSFEPAPPVIEGDPTPPCPLATLPGEILVHIFRELAIIDVASFVRIAQVCRRLAYLVATEEHIWRRVCQGSEVGFGAMHYQFQVEILGGPLEDSCPSPPSEPDDPAQPKPLLPITPNLTSVILHSLYSSSWQQMFRLRPRLRFNGCYISTNNYIRPGQAAPSHVTWNSPVHIVTYYRYLRFFRDGSVISLLTTTEPAEVVHHLTPELISTHQQGANAHLPSVVMQHALRGRWRLLPAAEHPDGIEGDVCVETEGVGPKYMYRQDLSLRSAGKGVRNNKLVWSGFWFYNRLTDDWAEFSRRNEKPLFWSRVRSYGHGA